MPTKNLVVADTGRYILNGPLSPKTLVETGVIGNLPSTSFDPEGEWSASYRLWLTNGRTNRDQTAHGDAILGLMKVARRPGSGSGEFTLKVDRYLRNETDRLHRLHAEIVCRNDALASPASWKLESEYQKPDGTPDPSISRSESGSRESAPATASSFGLFEAVQRFPFGSKEAVEFTLLDELDLEKPGHRLKYHGVQTCPTDSGDAKVHWIQQIGWGLLPIDYWLDDQHRLLVAVHSPLVYIREDLATSPLPDLLAGVADSKDAG